MVKVLKGCLSAVGLETLNPYLPGFVIAVRRILMAGLLGIPVGYVSANHWEDVEKLLGIGPEDPCGRPENTYFCI